LETYNNTLTVSHQAKNWLSVVCLFFESLEAFSGASHAVQTCKALEDILIHCLTGRTMTSKTHDNIYCISFHGIHHGPILSQKDIVVYYIDFWRWYHQRRRVRVILGEDFNTSLVFKNKNTKVNFPSQNANLYPSLSENIQFKEYLIVNNCQIKGIKRPLEKRTLDYFVTFLDG